MENIREVYQNKYNNREIGIKQDVDISIDTDLYTTHKGNFHPSNPKHLEWYSRLTDLDHTTQDWTVGVTGL